MLRTVIHDVQAIAAEVIRKAGREKPADAALREVLKQIPDLAPFDAAEVARTVFIYYRWHVWLCDERGVQAKMRLALRLNQRFKENPASIPLAELHAKAVPEWTAEHLEVNDGWLRSLQSEPKLWLRAKSGQAEALAGKLFGAETSPLLPDALVFNGETDLFKTPEFHAGEFEIQDIASQMVSWLCSPQPGETWWDTCAGEGGKMLHLSELMQNKGLIWASDRAAWRLQKLKRRAGRAKVFNYRSAAWDGGAKLPTKTKFDGVLVDAPCSGVGTWQRNPQARWTTTPNDVRELAEIQRKLLANVAPSLKPGGKLIFSVCTLTHAETVEVVEYFNATQPDFEPLVWEEIKLETRTLENVPQLTIWPQDLGGNGMFIAGWRRKKN
ncbi:MAG TPA: RsmB/NOP family class I SAM-dependent RNA methyltransferase [Candidatus Binatia bacterium]|nr:RsmB/NOP family class I SAM-dependent RNA methyltransferase [Candidatus Binatia bacterium]